MKSKEEILNSQMPDLIEYPHYSLNNFQESTVYEAMDEYAKQMAIGFADFIQENSYTKGNGGWYRYYSKIEESHTGFTMSTPVYDYLTQDQLYNLYLEHLKQQTNGE